MYLVGNTIENGYKIYCVIMMEKCMASLLMFAHNQDGIYMDINESYNLFSD